MGFRPPKKQPKFADLKGILAQSKDTDNSIYQTIQVMIERLTQLQDVTEEKIAEAATGGSTVINNLASKFASYHTKNDDIAVLPNSIQLLAGPGIEFDDTVPSKRTIRIDSTFLTHYDAPLSDGDLVAADLIYAAGECIIVQVPI